MTLVWDIQKSSSNNKGSSAIKMYVALLGKSSIEKSQLI